MTFTPTDPALAMAEAPQRREIRGFRVSRPELRAPFMVAFLAAVAAGLFTARDQLWNAFEANPAFNGVILAVFALAAAFAFWRITRLSLSARWLRAAARDGGRLGAPRAFAPLARLMDERGEGRWPSRDVEARLDASAARLDEDRDTARYLTGLLVFLGLLGTFWGLLLTIAAVAEAFRNLDFQGGAADAAVAELIDGLRRPIGGMSTAFSSSLFGLGGSLIAGFFDLQANRAQSRLVAEAEDWARGRSAERDAGEAPQAYLSALIETLADRVEGLETVMDRFDRRSGRMNEQLATFLDAVTQQLTARDRPNGDAAAAEYVARLRAIEGAVDAVRREVGEGREALLSQLRADMKFAARAVAGAGVRPSPEDPVKKGGA